MDPITIGLMLGTSVLKGGFDYFSRKRQANKQERLAKELEAKYTRPQMPTAEYLIPKEYTENRDLALSQYYDTLIPGQSAIENNIQGATATGTAAAMRSGASSADILSVISGLNTMEQNRYQELGIAGAEMQRQDMGMLMDANQNLAGARDRKFQIDLDQRLRKWQWEEADPYMQAMQSAARLRDASNMNSFQAGQGASNALGDLAGIFAFAGMDDDFEWSEMFKNTKPRQIPDIVTAPMRNSGLVPNKPFESFSPMPKINDFYLYQDRPTVGNT